MKMIDKIAYLQNLVTCKLANIDTLDYSDKEWLEQAKSEVSEIDAEVFNLSVNKNSELLEAGLEPARFSKVLYMDIFQFFKMNFQYFKLCLLSHLWRRRFAPVIPLSHPSLHFSNYHRFVKAYQDHHPLAFYLYVYHT